MASESEGTGSGDSPGTETSDKAMPLLSLGTALGEPSGSGAVASSGRPQPKVVTDDVLLTSLKDMEKRVARMIAKAMQGKKRIRLPSPEQEPPGGEVLFSGELDQDDKAGSDEDPIVEEPEVASQGESLWVQALTDLVHEAFNVPVPELQVSAVSALGSLTTCLLGT